MKSINSITFNILKKELDIHFETFPTIPKVDFVIDDDWCDENVPLIIITFNETVDFCDLETIMNTIRHWTEYYRYILVEEFYSSKSYPECVIKIQVRFVLKNQNPQIWIEQNIFI